MDHNTANWVPELSEEWQQQNPNWRERDPEDAAAWGGSGRDKKAEQAERAKRGTTHGRLRVFGADDVGTAPPRDYLLKGLLSPGEMSVWVGAPKCGKSFLLLYVAYMLALGRTVFGRRVKPTKILYVAAEGEAGISKRIQALQRKYGRAADFNYIAQPIDLLNDNGHKLEVIEAAMAVGAQLIVIDTLNRAIPGGEESTAKDMGTFIANISAIREHTNAHIAIIHHGTKASEGRSPRGHSSLEGADDALVEVVKQANGSRVVTVVHAKDDADGMSWTFKLDQVELGIDEDGDPITTLIVNEDAVANPGSEAIKHGKPVRLSNSEQIALAVFDKAMKAESVLAPVGPNGEERPVITEATWRRWYHAEAQPGETRSIKQQSYRRAVDGLMAKGRIASQDTYVWRPEIWGDAS